MRIPFLDLKIQYSAIRQEIRAAIDKVCESQEFILGPVVKEFEEKIADYCRARHAVGVSSGTDALLLALMAERVGQGDEIILPPYTFFATAGVVVRLGAKPVFVDIEPGTYTLDPKKIEEAITRRTKAIIAVHLFGQACDMVQLLEISRRHNLTLIEDAAQALGAEYGERRVGSEGHFGCFSFFPSKNLGAFGDGGLITTSNDILADRLLILRMHGAKPKYYHKEIGGNFRLDAIQAAILSVKMKYLDDWISLRQRNAAFYLDIFRELNILGYITPPAIKRSRHVFNQFVIRATNRNDLREHLLQNGIGTEIYYPLPLHLQECFAYLGHKRGDFEQAEQAAENSLALPCYPELSVTQIEYISRKIGEFYTT